MKLLIKFRMRLLYYLKGILRKEKIFGLVMEWMSKGDLFNFVKLEKDPRSAIKISFARKITFFRDICAGMSYLSENKVHHRDLAARNVLLGLDLFENSLSICIMNTKNYSSIES